MSFKPFVVAPLIFALACGPSASVASARDSSARGPFTRFYVTVEQGSADPEYATALDAALRAELGRHAVAVNSRIRRGLDLDDKAAEQEIASWRPDAVLVVNFAGGSGTGANLESTTYDVSLVDVGANRRVWRAQASSRRALGTTQGMMEETAIQVAERLEQDRLIAPAR